MTDNSHDEPYWCGTGALQDMGFFDDVPVCTPPRSWMLDDGTTIHAGSRVRHTPTGEREHPMPADALGTVDSFAGPGWALVRWDRGEQELTHPSDLAAVELDDEQPRL